MLNTHTLRYMAKLCYYYHHLIANTSLLLSPSSSLGGFFFLLFLFLFLLFLRDRIRGRHALRVLGFKPERWLQSVCKRIDRVWIFHFLVLSFRQLVDLLFVVVFAAAFQTSTHGYFFGAVFSTAPLRHLSPYRRASSLIWSLQRTGLFLERFE